MKSRLNYEFSKKELILLLSLTIICLVMIYYRFVYVPIQDRIASYNTASLEDQILVQQATAMKIQKMKDAIAEGQGSSLSEVVTYDNLKAEIIELNQIVSSASEFDFSFQQPYAEGNVVRRNITLTFTASDYENAEKIIKNLYNCRYRCQIGDLSIASTGNNRDVQTGEVRVSLQATFYETLYGATTTDGLIIVSDSSSDSSSES